MTLPSHALMISCPDEHFPSALSASSSPRWLSAGAEALDTSISSSTAGRAELRPSGSFLSSDDARPAAKLSRNIGPSQSVFAPLRGAR